METNRKQWQPPSEWHTEINEDERYFHHPGYQVIPCVECHVPILQSKGLETTREKCPKCEGK